MPRLSSNADFKILECKVSFTILFSCIGPSAKTHSFTRLSTVINLGLHNTEELVRRILVIGYKLPMAMRKSARAVNKKFAVLLEAVPMYPGTIETETIKIRTSSLTLEDFLWSQIHEYLKMS